MVVTGGAGFLGRHIVERLGKFKGTEIFIPTRKGYDLVEPADVKCLLSDTRPQLVIHPAAVVGGIGANQNNRESFYENLLMGTQLIEQAPNEVNLRKQVEGFDQTMI